MEMLLNPLVLLANFILVPGLVYGSLFSGVDFFAVALDLVTGGSWPWSFAFAAEKKRAPRQVHAEAWGERCGTMLLDARAAARTMLPQVHVLVITPPCQCFTALGTLRLDRVEQELDALTEAARCIDLQRPNVVIVEITAGGYLEKEDIGAARPLLRRFEAAFQGGSRGYRWHRQLVSPELHAGVPVRRPRLFWIGVRASLPRLSLVAMAQAAGACAPAAVGQPGLGQPGQRTGRCALGVSPYGGLAASES